MKYTRTGATLSPDRIYRYTLERWWDVHSGVVNFIGLNPSTADETDDDPTIRRCAAFAKRRGCSGFVMTNLFGFRATDPSDMRRTHHDPIGPANDAAIRDSAKRGSCVIACWGGHGSLYGRGDEVLNMLWDMGIPLSCFGTTKSGQPKHPLYLPATTQLTRELSTRGAYERT